MFHVKRRRLSRTTRTLADQARVRVVGSAPDAARASNRAPKPETRIRLERPVSRAKSRQGERSNRKAGSAIVAVSPAPQHAALSVIRQGQPRRGQAMSDRTRFEAAQTFAGITLVI
jgi:hypothetical protein